MKAINVGVIEEYRRSGGSLSGDLAELPVLLLTTRGRRTGAAHVTPLGYIEDGDGYVVVGSAGGAPSDPDWCRNLVATPAVTVEVGAAAYPARATVAAGPERQRLFDRLEAALPGMAKYAEASGRQVPVVVLTPERSDG